MSGLRTEIARDDDALATLAVADGCDDFHFPRGQDSYKYERGAVDRRSVRRTLARGAALA